MLWLRLRLWHHVVEPTGGKGNKATAPGMRMRDAPWSDAVATCKITARDTLRRGWEICFGGQQNANSRSKFRWRYWVKQNVWIGSREQFPSPKSLSGHDSESDSSDTTALPNRLVKNIGAFHFVTVLQVSVLVRFISV